MAAAVITWALAGRAMAATPRGPSTKALPLPGATLIEALCWQISPVARTLDVQRC